MPRLRAFVHPIPPSLSRTIAIARATALSALPVHPARFAARALAMASAGNGKKKQPGVEDLRVSYSPSGLDASSFRRDPFAQFRDWFAAASASEAGEVNAMCLATADACGRPSARMVLLKGFDERGFVWYTNYESRKAVQISENPHAALVFWWASLERSVRVEGTVQRVPPAESDAYFAVRPPESRLGAWVSDQSRPMDSLETITARWAKLKGEHLADDGTVKKPIERPSHWGGFCLVPELIEFWKGRSARLHDRIQYTRDDVGKNEWVMQQLQP